MGLAGSGAPVEIRTFAHDRAVRRGVEHLAVEHAPVFERQMQFVSVFRVRTPFELHEARLSARADLDLIVNRAEIARTAFHAPCSM